MVAGCGGRWELAEELVGCLWAEDGVYTEAEEDGHEELGDVEERGGL